MSTFQTILTAAQQYAKVKQYQKGYYATHSPLRDDHKPSLLFGESPNGRPWFKDLATDTDPPAILRAWGLNPDTLETEVNDHIKPPRRQPGQRRRFKIDYTHPSAIYNYVYADGSPAYQVRRFGFVNDKGEPDKTFVQYRWEGGRWQRDRAIDGPELLYCLPEVVKAQRILGGEGEKVVEALRSIGYVATTHAGGAKTVNKALPAYRESLHDKDFIYLPDNDEPGRAMAKALENGRLPVRSGVTVDPALFGGEKADAADLIARLKAALLSNEEIRAEIDRILDQARPWGHPTTKPQPTQPGPKELERLAAREQVLAEAAQRREQRQAQRAAHEAEAQRRRQASEGINFVGLEEIDPDQVEHMRAKFTNAEKWRDYVAAHWPDLDAEEQYQIKLEENREARPGQCGEYRKRTLPNGQVQTYRYACGVCPDCLKRSVTIYRRALGEIQGIRADAPAGAFVPLAVLESYDPEDRQWITHLVKEIFGLNLNPPHEDAPPLEKINGDLSIVRVHGDKERLQFARELRTTGILYRALPITLEDGPAYDFILNDDRGDPLGLVNEARIELWVIGAKNKRASGSLLPGLKKLEQRYRPALPYEIVLPELDDDGQPVDPDIFVLELPDIGTTAKLPPIVVDFEVNDIDSLQAAIFETHREQSKILGRRGAVNYGVISKKRFYTRYSTLPDLLADFNARQKGIKQRKSKNRG